MRHTQPSLPTPIASKFFPLRVLRSWRMGTASRLISFSDGGGEPSTQPFHPFLTATRFFFCFGSGGANNGTISSSSPGVLGRLDDVREVLEEIEGSGVFSWDDGNGNGELSGGGVTEVAR